LQAYFGGRRGCRRFQRNAGQTAILKRIELINNFELQSTFKTLLMLTSKKRLGGILTAAGLLLLLPLIAMQFTAEVAWTLSDFVVAGVLFFGTGLLCEFVLRRVKKRRGRLLICGAILAALILVWIEMAVGIFDSPLAGS
jgi:peptidoglycan/LPS O-acetylase OafA/YrhL